MKQVSNWYASESLSLFLQPIIWPSKCFHVYFILLYLHFYVFLCRITPIIYLGAKDSPPNNDQCGHWMLVAFSYNAFNSFRVSRCSSCKCSKLRFNFLSFKSIIAFKVFKMLVPMIPKKKIVKIVKNKCCSMIDYRMKKVNINCCRCVKRSISTWYVVCTYFDWFRMLKTFC